MKRGGKESKKAHILLSNRQKSHIIPKDISTLLERACSKVLCSENFKENCEISITFVDDEKIRELNKKYRGKDKATDVLSFPLIEDDKYDYNERKEVVLGDIVISIETAYNQAKMYNNTIQRELAFLTVHSMLNLLGYNLEEGGIKRKMIREKEDKILNDLGLEPNTGYIEYGFK